MLDLLLQNTRSNPTIKTMTHPIDIPTQAPRKHDASPITSRRGRPRKSGKQSLDQRADIQSSAIVLFQSKGYQATSMTEIAHSCGLSQSSLYYWYGNKAEILRDILIQNHASQTVIERLSTTEASFAAQLYAFMVADVQMLCTLPLDYYDLERIAHSDPEAFSDFFDTYKKLRKDVRKLLDDGVASDVFTCSDSQLAVLTMLSLNEALQHRYRVEEHTKQQENIDKFAHLGARCAVKLIAPGLDLDPVAEEAAPLLLDHSDTPISA